MSKKARFKLRADHALVTPGELNEIPVATTDQIISAEVEEGGKIRLVWVRWDEQKEDE